MMSLAGVRYVLSPKPVVFLFIRDVGLPRQRPDAEEVSVHHDEKWS